MKRPPTAWSLIGLALLALALVVLPARVMAREPADMPCYTMATGSHHSGGGLANSPADCLMICAALPAPAPPQLAERTSYVLRFRDVDTVLRGINVDPEHPPPR